MKLLAFDTSTEFLSAALACGGALVAEENAAGGALASATLIPVLQGLLARAGIKVEDLDAIVFGSGPGSFTGLRTACAVAQGLGFGAGVRVLGIETLMAVAEQARQSTGASQVVAMLDARMNEVYAGRYVFEAGHWQREGQIALLRPAQIDVPDGWPMAGNVFAAYGSLMPAGPERIEALPTAAAMLRIAPRLIEQGGAGSAADAAPVYIRDKVAQTTEERAQARDSRPAAP